MRSDVRWSRDALKAGYRTMLTIYLRRQQVGAAFPADVSDPTIGHALAWCEQHLREVQREILYESLVPLVSSPTQARQMADSQAVRGRTL
jgi:hypothetical protein